MKEIQPGVRSDLHEFNRFWGEENFQFVYLDFSSFLPFKSPVSVFFDYVGRAQRVLDASALTVRPFTFLFLA